MRVGGWGCVAAALFLGCGGNTTSGGEGNRGGSGGGATTHALSIHTGGNGSGAVRSASPALECKSQCTQSIAANAQVQLTAVADAGSTFTGWQGACSGTGDCTVTLDADRDVTALFSANPPPRNARVTVLFTGKGVGRVTSAPAGIDCPGTCTLTVQQGATVSLTAQPDASSIFLGWGGACTGPGSCSVTASADQDVWASFDVKAPPPPPHDSCAGIAPPADVARQAYTALMREVACMPGLGDANGTLAFPSAYHSSSSHGSLVDFVSTSTGFLQSQYFTSEGPRPIQQPVGLTGAGSPQHMSPFRNEIHLARWDSRGNSLGDPIWYGQNFAPAGDPAGGLLLAGDLAPTPTAPAQHAAVMFTGGGAPYAVKWGPNALASSGAVFGAGVDSLGRALVITDGAPKFGGGNITAQWFDRDGKALTGEFVLVAGFTAGQATWFETSPLIGGGLMVRRMDTDYISGIHAHALVVLASGEVTARAAPDWMTARPDTRLQIAPLGTSYAVLPYGAPGVACTQRIEVLAPDGTSCGTRDYPIASGTCDTADLNVGEDGTVIQSLPRSMESFAFSTGAHTCTWRWWARAVR
jgi:hypothetical protein